MREYQNKNKNVIHAQRILDEITREKIQPVLWSPDAPDQYIKCKRHQQPDHGALNCGAHAQFPTAALGGEEVNSDCNKDADVKGNPNPQRRSCDALTHENA